MDAEVSAAQGQPGAKEKALRAIFQSHRRRILAGETISDEEMRADYESALGEPLKAPPASGTPNPAGGKPPIQTCRREKGDLKSRRSGLDYVPRRNVRPGRRAGRRDLLQRMR